MKLIRSKAKDDCVICTVAMLLGISYEESCKLFPRYFEPVGDGVRGVTETEINLALVSCGYVLGRFVPATRDTRGIVTDSSQEVIKLMKERPALIDTITSSGRRHAVAWDGNMVLDPARQRPWKLKNRYIVESVNLIVKLN